MTATCLELTSDRAVVLLRPCWLARWLGARTTVVQLVRRSPGEYRSDSLWRTSGSERPLHRSNRADARILDALDYRPTAELATARLLP